MSTYYYNSWTLFEKTAKNLGSKKQYFLNKSFLLPKLRHLFGKYLQNGKICHIIIVEKGMPIIIIGIPFSFAPLSFRRAFLFAYPCCGSIALSSPSGCYAPAVPITSLYPLPLRGRASRRCALSCESPYALSRALPAFSKTPSGSRTPSYNSPCACRRRIRSRVLSFL